MLHLPFRMVINVPQTTGCYNVTVLHHTVWAVGLSSHGSRMIHSRIAIADIQALRLANSEERV